MTERNRSSVCDDGRFIFPKEDSKSLKLINFHGQRPLTPSTKCFTPICKAY